MSEGSTIVAVLRLLVSLGVVLTLVMWLARYAAKRSLGGARAPHGAVAVDVLSRRSLGRTSSVQVVQVGRRTMVLGVTEHGVSVLGELDVDDLVRADAALPDKVHQSAGLSGGHGFERALVAQGYQGGHRVAARRPGPDGWPWSAASFVLRQVQARRG